MEAVKLDGTLRTDMSRQALRTAREKGSVACVMYGGESEVHFFVTSKSLKSLIYTPDFKKAEIAINGKTYTAIVQDTQFSPVEDKLVHIDFLELVGDKKVTVDLPVKFIGVAKGVRAGGKLLPRLRKLTVKSSPSSLRTSLDINVEELELGKHIRVRDVAFEGMEIITAKNNPIVSTFVPRQMKQEEATAKPAAGAKAAAPAAAAAAPAAKK
jgi:large subunit ribosomal protein L25